MGAQLKDKINDFSSDIGVLSEQELLDCLFDLEIDYDAFDKENFDDEVFKLFLTICLQAKNLKKLAFNLFSNIWNNIEENDSSKWTELLRFSEEEFHNFKNTPAGQLIAEFVGAHADERAIQIIDKWKTESTVDDYGAILVAVQELLNQYDSKEKDDVYQKAKELKKKLSAQPV